MTDPVSIVDGHSVPKWRSWLDKPLSGWWCTLGWVFASVVFLSVVHLLRGPSLGDSDESIYSTWAIAHGHFSCAYVPGNTDSFPFKAPLYPILSGALAALTRIGSSIPFPSQADLGPHCSAAVSSISKWYVHAGALTPTVNLGLFTWFALLAGLVAFLRASGRGRCRWEPVVLVFAACAPPIFMAVQRFAHPEDLLAMGLSLSGLACVLRRRWVWAGVLLGFAVMTQQFALLVLVPVVIVAPSYQRVRVAVAAVGASALLLVPLSVETSGRVIKALVGPGYQSSTLRTVVSTMDLHGLPLFVLSRLMPIVLSAVLATWAIHRLGRTVLDPLPLASLVGTSLSFRLVFEVNLYGYYFMAVAIILILLDVIRGRISVYVVAWIVLIAVPFYPLPWGFDPFGDASPLWAWQIVLVSTAFALLVRPLVKRAPAAKVAPRPVCARRASSISEA